MASQAQREQFVRDVTPYAEAASRASGIDRDVIIAQAAHESAWGTKAKGNNYFGIKGKGQSFTTHEVINGKTVKMKQGFRKYASPLDSFMDWAKLMTSKERYAPVINATTPEGQIAALGASGYATDPAYASKLRSITTRVKSMVGAAADVVGLDGQVGIQGGVLGRGRKNNPESVRAIQAVLKEAGVYDGEIDGDFGPRTERAVRLAQEVMGVPVDGKWGPKTNQAAQDIGLISAPTGVSLEARDEAYQANLLANAPKLTGYTVSQSSAVPQISGKLDLIRPQSLTGSVLSQTSAIPEASIRMGPVDVHSAPKRALTAPPGNEVAGLNAQLARQNEAIRQGWSIQAARQKAGIDPVSVPTPRPNPRYAQTIGANSTFADPSVERQSYRPDFNATVGPANAPVASSVLSRAPTLAEFDRRFGGPRPIAPRRVQTTSIPQSVPIAAGASARPAPDPSAMSRAFDISGALNYQPAAPKQDLSSIFNKVQAPTLPSRTISTPQVSAVSGAPMKTTDIPASMQPGYPKAPQALTPGQAAWGARYAGMAAQPQAPAYQPVSPMSAAPIPRPNPLAAPQVMGASATPVPPPPSAFKKLAPGMIGMAMAGGPMGVLGGMARLAAASLGNVNNPRGLGFDPVTAARNAAVARGVQASDLVGNGASYGRRQSDGSVTGTTSKGTGYTSRDGGREISIGGRTYEKKRAGYSMKL